MLLDANDPVFQAKTLAVMMENPQFLVQYRTALSRDLWGNEDLQQLYRGIVGYWDAYQRTPGYDELKAYIRQKGTRKEPIAVASWDEWVDTLQKLGNNGDLAFVYDSFVQFVRYRVLHTALEQAARKLELYDFDAVLELVRQAHCKEIRPEDGIDFYADIYHRLTTTITRECIPTSIGPLDDILKGGTAKGEMTVVLAPPSVGKTTFLINLGAAAVQNEAKVFHFFAEQTEEIIWARYAARLTKNTFDWCRTHPKKAAYLLQTKQRGELRICNCLGWKVEQIRSYIYRHGCPDAVIIDYADKLVPGKHYAEYRHEVKRIYDELVALMKEWGVAVWTASQTNRAALGKEKITIKDFAEAFDKAAIADNVLALCQSDQEAAVGNMRIFLAKVRNEEGNQEIPVKIYRDRMLISGKLPTDLRWK